MIKVCHIVNLITGKADGVYTHLKMIFENSDKEKFRHFLIFQGGEKVEREVYQMGVKVFVCESLKKKISINAFSDIYKIIKENDIDIIHTHLIKPYAIAGLVNIILRKKFIFNYHGIFVSRNVYYGFIEKLIYWKIHFILYLFRVVDAVLVPSQKGKELLLAETKLFPEPFVYYNGYSLKQSMSEPDVELSERIEDLRKDKKIIAVIGRLEVDKRIDKAIAIIKNLIFKKEKVHLLVFGDGRLKNELKNLIDKENLNDNIDLSGYVSGVNNYYKFFDVVLFTSDWEGMPLTMWEAMANRVPIVAPDVGGFKEILEENNCGLVYEQHNLDNAEQALLKLLRNEELRIKLGTNGFGAIKDKYNTRNFIKQIENIYSGLMKI
jgi:glycosyltransferase involved in cell wall biosynthesis